MVVSVNKIAAYRTWNAVEKEWQAYTDELDARLQDPKKTARMSAERLQELTDKVAWMKATRMELVIIGSPTSNGGTGYVSLRDVGLLARA